MYIQRQLSEKLKYLAKHFPVVLLCGARQTGKTTLLKHFCETAEEKINYVTLDYPRLRTLARTDPELFLQQYSPPLIIDEIQYAPELLPYIKIRADEEQKPGQYFLTGSQMFRLMQNVSESLAGRVGLLSMYPLSRGEILGYTSEAFSPETIAERKVGESVTGIFEKIHRGSMPKMIADAELNAEDFYESYVQTYLERDIRELVAVQNETKFMKFISCVAARTAQEVNLNDIARDVDIDRKTADSWLSVLVSSGLVFLLHPYSGNTIKRIVKRPKLYFMDTGLACHLCYWNNPRALELSAMAGAMFETYVVSEIIKSYANNGIDAGSRLFYYRDNNQKEIDLLILQNNRLCPVEIKLSSDPGRGVLKNFTVLDSLNAEIGKGAVICLSPLLIPLDGNNTIVPVGCI